MRADVSIVEVAGEPKGWRYHSGLALWTERLVDGRLLCASLQDNGIAPYLRDELRDQAGFELVVDGESLASGWTLVGFTKSEGPRGVATARLVLRHERLPVDLTVETDACGRGFFRRRIKIRNTSRDRHLGITTVCPLAGAAWASGDALRDGLDAGAVPYSVGRFEDTSWATEGRFGWTDVPRNAGLSFGSAAGKSGHGHPFAVVRNNLFGGHLVCQLAWSGNWRMEFQEEKALFADRVCLRFRVGPTAVAPQRVIAPGEEVTAPEVHLGLSHSGLDEAVQALHAHQREHVLRRVGDGLQPVILNHWGYMEHEMSEERLRAEIDVAAEIGAELFMVDAGWFGDVGTPWHLTTGDWRAGNRLPKGLEPVFDYARSRGLKVGLWVEAESAGSSSRLAADHPDWFIERDGKPVERILDLAKPEVARYVEAEIVRLVERYRLDMFRLDHNVYPLEGGANPVAGRRENSLWRSVEAIYGIIDRVRARFPSLQWENCAGGGGRTDIGMVSRATTTWVSDWMKMPRTVRILNGMSLALPPEYLDRLYGGAMEAGYRGNAETQLHLAVLAHPTLSGLAPSAAEANPELLALVKKYVSIYKEFIRPFHRESLVYHHTPEIAGTDGEGWCALEYASADRRRAVAGVFRLFDAGTDSYRLRFRGLDPGRAYRVTHEPGSLVEATDGRALSHEGIDIRLEAPMTSRLLLVEARD